MVGFYDIDCYGLNCIKEADINFFFKVLAKFGDNKHNKDIKKIVEKKCFFSSKGGGGGVKFGWKIP